MSYILDTSPTISLPAQANHPVIKEFLSNYTYGRKWNIIFHTDGNFITLGKGTKANRVNSEYTINITDEGVFIDGGTYQSLMRGFITFLEKIRYSEKNKSFYIENECIAKSPLLAFRCVHLCIFPETNLDFFKKCVRSCAIAKFSHIIFEFWGMLKFDCMSELSWPFAHSKEEIKKIVHEANALGLEIIPMFNHLGHASACREVNGKHVVLDQKPEYEYMFTSYGWAWNFNNDDVYKLLSKVRDELIDVCGEGNYFHIGCDEAYSLGHNHSKTLEVVAYLNKISDELKSKGRRCILWHDMLLSKNEFPDYVASSNDAVSEIFINNLNKEIIIADWQYSCHNETWKTSKKFKENNFNVVCCPWDNKENINQAINTVTENNLYGIIHTTWHTLFTGFKEMIYSGIISYGNHIEDFNGIYQFYASSVARKAMPSCGEYEKCGWSEKMTGPGLC